MICYVPRSFAAADNYPLSDQRSISSYDQGCSSELENAEDEEPIYDTIINEEEYYDYSEFSDTESVSDTENQLTQSHSPSK